MKDLIKYTLLVSLVLFGFSFWLYDELPSPRQINPALAEAPVVTPTTTQAFIAHTGKKQYLIEPVQEYELYGLVVSKHNARGWRGQIHKEVGDHINVADLCVLWGANVTEGHYQGASFSSAQFTCYVMPADRAFNPALFSNNHMLSDDKQLIRQLHNIEIGDQIRLKGYLANYSKYQRGKWVKIRDTDLTIGGYGRTACETIYTTQIEVLKKNRNIWQWLYWLSLTGIIGSIIGWFCIPQRAHLD